MDPALALTSDPLLADELGRLAAAAGVPLRLVADGFAGGAADRTLAAWSSAPLVLVGADRAAELAALAPARRPGVLVVCWSPPPDGAFRDALLLGAERVLELPAAAPWVTEALIDLGEAGRGDGALLGVLGGSGGAGATTLACALAQVAAERGPTLLVDLDPLGPGCERMLALDAQPGVRWDSLGRASGRLSARSLREAVPRGDGPGVLGFTAHPLPLEASAVREALSAARRGHDTVVVDLPRAGGTEETLARCDLVVLVVVPSYAGVTAAARRLAAVADPSRVGLVVRGRGADPARVADLVGAPALAVMPDQRGLDEALDLGLGPVRSRRSPLARAARAVLAAATDPGAVAA
ncbi:septum site-determining protein Ssd [Nocardioides flavescens]|uniref:septum site-determining protein Ssd n=1 Tax=Nocardioides flavescens TaxID=2691959 RepID=UPI001926F6BA|nr:septum site-determining protein Ssd [Nocardioides flavescens]